MKNDDKPLTPEMLFRHWGMSEDDVEARKNPYWNVLTTDMDSVRPEETKIEYIESPYPHIVNDRKLNFKFLLIGLALITLSALSMAVLFFS